jgi:demethylmenaquinone methyltransferase/2-methoxy-6-polyprenyl-1,4-benzoquinol methylase
MSTVSPGGEPDKHAAVQRMFGRIAWRYDLMNALMTGGLDGRWRKIATAEAAVPAGGRALDIGSGTGDLALALAMSAPAVRVVGLDYTPEMLRLAPAKARRMGVAGLTGWVLGDAHRLPFEDAEFDAVTSAFVLRNLADLPEAFSEMARVTRSGGRVVALEINPESSPVWRPLFELYFSRVVPVLGRLVSGDRDAYTYLPASVAAFLHPSSVAAVMSDAGLVPLAPRRLLAGSIAVHVGRRP